MRATYNIVASNVNIRVIFAQVTVYNDVLVN